MTIIFKASWNGYEQGTVQTLGSTEEARLIAAGIAATHTATASQQLLGDAVVTRDGRLVVRDDEGGGGDQVVGSGDSRERDRPIIVSGSYVGRGNGWLLDLGFRPDLVIIKGDSDPGAIFNDGHWYGGPQGFGALVLDGPISYARPCVSDQGLTIEESSTTYYNESGKTYYYVAIKDNGSGVLRTVAYNGFRNQTVAANGTNSNAVTMDALADTFPALLHIKRDAMSRPGVWVGDGFVKPVNDALSPSLLTFDGDGTLELGTDPRVNENDGGIIGEAHHVFALYRPGQFWDYQTVTGNGGTTTVSGQAEISAVIVLPMDSTEMQFWLGGMGEQSADGGQTALHSGRISVSGSQISLQGVCNTAGVTYRVAILYKTAAPEKRLPALARRSGVAITTDGSGVIDCGNSDTLAIAGAHSMEWIGYITDSNSEQVIMSRMSGGRGTPAAGSCGWAMAYTRDPDSGLEICTSDRFSQQTTNESKQQRFRTGLVLEPWKPVHILYTHDGTDEWLVYINGVLRKWRRLPMSVFTLPGITATTGLRNAFGARWSGSAFVGAKKTGHYFGRLYNRALTADEVGKMYSRHFLSQNLRDITDSASALVEEWKFTEATGTTVAATVSSANNGAMTGAGWIR